jgi:hypothetical protein
VNNPQVKQPCLSNQVYSMIPFIKLSEYLFEIPTNEESVGSQWRGREREREQWINGVRDGVLAGTGNSTKAISEKGHLSIFSKTDQ